MAKGFLEPGDPLPTCSRRGHAWLEGTGMYGNGCGTACPRTCVAKWWHNCGKMVAKGGHTFYTLHSLLICRE